MKKTIYIADDESNIRNLVLTFLEREGYDVTAFPDGESKHCFSMLLSTLT